MCVIRSLRPNDSVGDLPKGMTHRTPAVDAGIKRIQDAIMDGSRAGGGRTVAESDFQWILLDPRAGLVLLQIAMLRDTTTVSLRLRAVETFGGGATEASIAERIQHVLGILCG